MKTIFKILLLVAAVAAGFYFGQQKYVEHRAEARVKAVLEGWRAGGTGSTGFIQDAVCQWDHGSPVPSDMATLSLTSDAFDTWRRQKGLYREISSYSVDSVRMERGAADHATRVELRIDGERYAVLVRDRSPIAWAD